jgi:SAM-dependent methyltransferase
MLDKQIAYYAETASQYDAMHVTADDEHYRALEHLHILTSQLEIRSVLDVGCGTGRALEWCARHLPEASLAGLDPSPDLLGIAATRVPKPVYHRGEAQDMPYANGEFDLVIATGIMHHVEAPERCIREMFRVARKAILISDHNHFAFGKDAIRSLRLGLYAVKLLDLVAFIRQGFKRQTYSRGDGYSFPYSLLDNYRTIDDLSSEVYLLPTRPCIEGRHANFMLCQTHLAILALTRRSGE